MLQELMQRLGFRSGEHFDEHALINAYARQDISFVRGEGALLWDSNGRQYIDALGGIAVCFLGHSHPKISEAISLQASTLLHTSNLFHIQQQSRLGKRFCEISNMDKVFFCSTGTEANETAIKLSRLHARKRKIETPIVVCANNSFHGRSFGSLSASGNRKIQEGFEPLLEGFVHVDYDDVEAIENVSDQANIVAIMVEPIQGEGGILMPQDGYLKSLRQLCDDRGWLLIMDEIQAGIGRTGKWFGHQHEDIVPDVITSAKALGNGIPIGACAARGEAADLIGPGAHGTTFGGNPFSCQVALSVLEIIEQENYLERAESLGKLLKQQLQQHLGADSKVVDIRGRGLMLGTELDRAYPNIVQEFLNRGVVINVTGGGRVIRMLPSVMTSEAQIKQIAETTSEVVNRLK